MMELVSVQQARYLVSTKYGRACARNALDPPAPPDLCMETEFVGVAVATFVTLFMVLFCFLGSTLVGLFTCLSHSPPYRTTELHRLTPRRRSSNCLGTVHIVSFVKITLVGATSKILKVVHTCRARAGRVKRRRNWQIVLSGVNSG